MSSVFTKMSSERVCLRAALLGAALGLGAALAPAPSQAQPAVVCPNKKAIRMPLFGDLHVHTSYSMDAYRLDGTRNDPWDAYAFATGSSLWLTSFSQDGAFRLERDKVSTTIDRKLDFAAVTDHDGFLNQVGAVCSWWSPDADPTRYCPFSEQNAWQKIQQAARDYYAPCNFTTFVAYEWTKKANGTEKDPLLPNPWGQGSELHRNVIFKSDTVPPRPFTTDRSPLNPQGEPTPSELWKRLDRDCVAAAGCEAITIPHNPNLSNGFMFPDLRLGVAGGVPTAAGLANAVEFANLQRRYEPLMEIMQNKGSSECVPYSGVTFNGEEACNFEERNLFADASDAQQHGKSYAREALKTGLASYVSPKLGVNPYQLGFIGSTDTHNATPGAVRESTFQGHQGALDSLPSFRSMDSYPDVVKDLAAALGEDLRERLPRTNPGGLAVVWAEQNTRDSIFAALRRRETYATSGPRIILRVFGGWNLGADICGSTEPWIANAYGNDTVVPMGGQLGSRGRVGNPRFVISVAKDPGQPPSVPVGNNLEQIELIKGWVDASGKPQSKVVSVFAPGTLLGNDAVDPNTCQLRPAFQTAGFATKCLAWEDTSWAHEVGAENRKNVFYYVRVTEVPSCRWTRYDKLRNPNLTPAAGVPDVIRERAWSSPIWFVD
ncbi:MAG TPA: DUF3604 domain-containing protein [Polyangiales bacterium]